VLAEFSVSTLLSKCYLLLANIKQLQQTSCNFTST